MCLSKEDSLFSACMHHAFSMPKDDNFGDENTSSGVPFQANRSLPILREFM